MRLDANAVPLSRDDHVWIVLACDPDVIAANDHTSLVRYRFTDVEAIAELEVPDSATYVRLQPLDHGDLRRIDKEAGHRYPSGQRALHDAIRAGTRELERVAAEQQALQSELAAIQDELAALAEQLGLGSSARAGARLAELEAHGAALSQEAAAEVAGLRRLEQIEARRAELRDKVDLRPAADIFEDARAAFVDGLPSATRHALACHDAWRLERAIRICEAAVVEVRVEEITAVERRHDGFPVERLQALVDVSARQEARRLAAECAELEAACERLRPQVAANPEDDELGGALARALGAWTASSARRAAYEHLSGEAAVVEIAAHVEEVIRLPKARLTCFRSPPGEMGSSTPRAAASTAGGA